jgi:hypothetical protein
MYLFYSIFLVPVEGLFALRAHPFGAASGLRPTAFNLGCAQVVEPFLFYVGGSTYKQFDERTLQENFDVVPDT